MVPALHSRHAVLLASGAYVPGVHWVQALEAGVDTDPGVQGMHSEDRIPDGCGAERAEEAKRLIRTLLVRAREARHTRWVGQCRAMVSWWARDAAQVLIPMRRAVPAGHTDGVGYTVVVTVVAIGAVVARASRRTTVPNVADAVRLCVRARGCIRVQRAALTVAGVGGLRDRIEGVDRTGGTHLLSPGPGRGHAVCTARGAEGTARRTVPGLVPPGIARGARPTRSGVTRVAHTRGDVGLGRAEAARIWRACEADAGAAGTERIRVFVVGTVETSAISGQDFVGSNRTGRAGLAVRAKMPGYAGAGGEASALAWAAAVLWALGAGICVVGCLCSRVRSHRADVADALVVPGGVPSAPTLVTSEVPGIVRGVVTWDAATL
eukprot:762433-Hanusia_phi.AAC.19